MSVSFDHVEDPARRFEAEALARLFREASGFEPALWGKIIGFGRYAYTYGSGRSGESFATGFAMRARDIALHIMPGYSDFPEIAERLGPHKRGKACWYVRRLADVDEQALVALVRAGLADLERHWPVLPS